MSHRFRDCLILTGPTSSGKSSLALEIAEAIHAEIVAMDSMTVYRGMDIGTAKPTAAERGRVQHHLVDCLDPWDASDVSWWLGRAGEAVADIEKRGKKALVVGGTPFYLKALLMGLFEGPAADPAIRRRLENVALIEGDEALHRRLSSVDPVTARRLHPNDRRRVIRALEVIEQSGRPMSEWQQEWRATPDPASMPRCWWIDRPRAELYSRINCRVETMIAQGWVTEADALRRLQNPLSREASQALGYRELFDFLDGVAGIDETVERIKTRSRQFAKRQVTWFRHLPGCRPLSAIAAKPSDWASAIIRSCK
jgi:tRNA dimethylallyltransferase